MRIIITGGRNRNVLLKEVDREVVEAIRSNEVPAAERVVIVQGGCPTGVDAAAVEYAEARGWSSETFTAEWKKYGRAAGPKRNERMATLGADLCLAFPSASGSPGTWDMIRRAAAHGIRTIIIPEDVQK